MNLDSNIKVLKSYLKQFGWKLIKHDELFEYYENNLGNSINFPLLKKDKDYPIILEIAIKKTIELNPEIIKFPFLNLLISQIKNVKQKYIKDKSQWILFEPDSKYQAKDIPDIYIPKSYIFGRLE